jgi:hypothetical protein
MSPLYARRYTSRLANASGRIEFIIFLIMDWLFASGCSPPRLSATQLPSATDSQCSVRRGLSPRCWCALSGALRAALNAAFTNAKNDRQPGAELDASGDDYALEILDNILAPHDSPMTKALNRATSAHQRFLHRRSYSRFVIRRERDF